MLDTFWKCLHVATLEIYKILNYLISCRELRFGQDSLCFSTAAVVVSLREKNFSSLPYKYRSTATDSVAIGYFRLQTV